jgi:aminoglycoside 3-N-acetyltransferase
LSEADTIAKTDTPATVETLKRDLATLGVRQGATLLVHSSLSSIGWVCGGAVAVIQALEASLGEQGTLVMPAFSGGMTEPSHWQAPPVPETWWETIRTATPAYDPDFTPTRCMGQVAETFRTRPGVTRSDHPNVSFCAFGLNAQTITANHALGLSFGEASPLARIYDFDG